MGMFDGNPAYDPTNPNDQTEQYKKPGSDPFAEFGIMPPMQKQMQAAQYQNMIMQNQLARQQQMLQLNALSQNMGSQAAQSLSGLSGPSMLMMGGGQPAFQNKLTNAVNQFLPGQGGGPSPFQQSQQSPQQGMTPPGPNVLQGVDYGKIVNDSLSKNGNNPSKGYADAADLIDKVGSVNGDPNAPYISARMRQKAFELQQDQSKSQSVTDKNIADSKRADSETAKNKADLTKPTEGFQVNTPTGNTKRVWSQYDPVQGKWVQNQGFEGTPITRTLDETPAQRGKEVDDFREVSIATKSTMDNIDKAKQLISQGAGVGTAAEAGIGTVNTVLGTLKQLVPGGVDIDKGSQDYLNSMYKSGPYSNRDFQSWAARTSVNESVLNDLTMNLAKTYAGSGKVSNQDIKRAAETIGEHIGDAKTFSTVLDSVRQRALDNYESRYKAYKASVNSPDEKQKLDNLHGMVNPSVQGDTSGIPADIQALVDKHAGK